jgi:hypothetical protein
MRGGTKATAGLLLMKLLSELEVSGRGFTAAALQIALWGRPSASCH